jgi:hypothetical protein
MAVLNQTPFQLPDFAKMAYEKSLVDEEKQRREEERQEAKLAQRQRTIESYGAKKTYLDKGYALEPAAKQMADLAFQQLSKYGTEYENTNSQEALSNYERALGQFNQIMGVGLAVRNAVDNDYEVFKQKPSEFTPESQKIAEETYRNRGKLNFAGAIENGVLMGTDPTTGKRVPATQISYFQSSVTPGVNTLGLQRIDPATKFLNADEYAQRIVSSFAGTKGVKVDTSTGTSFNLDALLQKGNEFFQEDLVNKTALTEAMIIKHNLKANGTIPTAQEKGELIAQYQKNPKLLDAARDMFWQDISKRIEMRLPASTVNAVGRSSTGEGVTRSQREDIDAIFAGTTENMQPVGTFSNQNKERYFVSGVDIPFKASTDIGIEDMIATGIGVDQDGKFVASMRDSNGQLVRDKRAQIALEKQLRQKGIFNPIMSVLKERYRSNKQGEVPSGYNK